MHNPIILILVLFLSLNSLGQELPGKIKYDSVRFSDSGDLALIYKGKKSSVYSLSKEEYLIEPVKSFIHYFGGQYNKISVEAYAIIGKESSQFLLVLNDTSTIYFLSKKLVMYLSFNSVGHTSIIGDLIGFNRLIFDNAKGVFIEQSDFYAQANLSIEMVSDEILVINNHRNWAWDYGIEDEIIIIDSGLYNSGVYNRKSQTWIIPPRYQQCAALNNYFICRKLIDWNMNNYFVVAGYSYDLYEWKDDNMILIKRDFESLSNEEIAKILNVDRVIPFRDSLHYKTIKDGDQGLIIFSLENLDNYNVRGGNFLYSELFSPDYDFIHFSPDQNVVISYKQNMDPNSDQNELSAYLIKPNPNYDRDSLESIIFLSKSISSIAVGNDDDGMNYLFSNDGFYSYSLGEADSIDLEFINESNFEYWYNYGIHSWNDSLLYISDFENDRSIWDLAFFLNDMWGDDSLDVNGNPVFLPLEPGYEMSGVYDLKKKAWEIQPVYRNCILTGSGFLLSKMIIESQNNQELSKSYKFIDFNHKTIFNNVSEDSIFNNLEMLKYTVHDFLVDSMFIAPTGSFSHNAHRKHACYYFRTDDKLGVYNSWSNNIVDDIIIKSPKEFIHYNPDLGYSFYLENDSIYLEFDSLIYVVGQKGKITLDISEDMIDEDPAFSISITINDETDSISNVSWDKIKPTNLVRNSIYIDKGKLVIIESGRIDTYDYYINDDYYQEIEVPLIIERENSSIWEKINGAWVKMTPYYANISVNPFCYIVNSGYFYNEVPVFDATYWEHGEFFYQEINVDRKYILLDSNYQAISFLDWYDFPYAKDLGFGIQICMDSGCFFIDYAGKAITDAEWDEFQLVGGKLKAIRLAIDNLDEFGDPLYDENGFEILFKPEEVEFFDLYNK